MPLWLFPALLAVSALITLTSGIWLLLHLTALSRNVAGNADVVPSPARPRASRGRVRVLLATFVVATLVTLVILVLVVSGVANEWIVSPRD